MRKLLSVIVFAIISVLLLSAGVFAQAGPTLNTPSNSATDLRQPISFNWSSISYGTVNNLVIDDDPDFSSPIYNINIGTSTAISLDGFQKGAHYYWRVRVYVSIPFQDPYWTNWSSTWSFSTECPDPPVLTIPTSGSNVVQPFQLEWDASDGAADYQVRVDDDPAFGSPALSNITTLTYEPVDGLDNDVQYYWQVRSMTPYCGNGVWSSAWSFTTECPLPADVVHHRPFNGVPVDFGFPVYFEWVYDPDILSCNLQVDDNSDFNSPMYDINTPDFYYYLSGFSKAVTYFWRVRGFNSCGYGNWSSAWSITVSCPETYAPYLLGPANEAVDLSLPLDFYWNGLSGAIDYHFQLDEDPAMGSPDIDGTTGGALTVKISLYLEYGITYYWRVRGVDECGLGTWSEIRSFTMVCPVLTAIPTLTSPADAAVDVFNPALLEWGLVSGASSIQIKIDDDPAFGSPTSNAEIYGVASTEFYVPSLTEAITYYWKVRARDACGWGEWSSSRSFVPIDLFSGLCGDVNNDGLVNILDIVYTINFKYKEGPEPCNPAPLPPTK